MALTLLAWRCCCCCCCREKPFSARGVLLCYARSLEYGTLAECPGFTPPPSPAFFDRENSGWRNRWHWGTPITVALFFFPQNLTGVSGLCRGRLENDRLLWLRFLVGVVLVSNFFDHFYQWLLSLFVIPGNQGRMESSKFNRSVIDTTYKLRNGVPGIIRYKQLAFVRRSIFFFLATWDAENFFFFFGNPIACQFEFLYSSLTNIHVLL